MLTVTGYGTAPEGLLTQTMEEHLLERISYLEYHLAHYRERWEKLLEITQNQNISVTSNEILLETLLDALDSQGGISKQAVESAWRLRLKKQRQQQEFLAQISNECEQIIRAAPRSIDLQFQHLVEDAFKFLAQGKLTRGTRLLEKASLLDSGNAPLNLFLGNYYWKRNKLKMADSYLSRVLESQPQNLRALILLGITCGDLGAYGRAKEYLFAAAEVAAEKDPRAFITYLVLGQVLAADNELDRALHYFRKALLHNPLPELNFIVGHIYLVKNNFKLAAHYLNRAIAADPQLDAALYNLGLICLKDNLLEEAREYFRTAYELNPNPRYRNALRVRRGANLPHLPIFATQPSRPRWIGEYSQLANLLRRFLSPQALG